MRRPSRRAASPASCARKAAACGCSATACLPGRDHLLARDDQRATSLVGFGRNVERLLRPPENRLGGARSLSAPSGAPCAPEVSRLVGAGSAMIVLRTISVGASWCVAADVSAASMSSRSLPSRTCSTCQPYATEARADIFRERQVGAAIDRDLVVVPDHTEAIELEVPGQRGGLARDALHHVAIGGDHPGAVVTHLGAVLVAQQPLGESPSRRRCRCPGRADRWSSRHRPYGRAPGDRASSSPIAGTA